MTRSPSRRLLALALATALAPAPAVSVWAQSVDPSTSEPAQPAEPVPAAPQPGVEQAAQASPSDGVGFTASDIRIDGLQRISAGTVFTYLPIERGDRVTPVRVAEAIQALYRTGFFRDVAVGRQGDILVVTVAERPAINELTLTGNKDIKTEDLMVGLQEIGLAEGDTFDQLALDRVTQELIRQYNNRGKYNVEITPTVTDLPRNRVDVALAIDEGDAAKIRHINLIGNRTYADEAILETWESAESNWLSWYRRDDQYSREKLSGDLEKLNAWYLDRGYVDFSVDSTQVAMSPDKQDMFITAGISEGDRYTISSVDITGNTVLPKERIERLVLVKPEQIFSRRLLEISSESITATLGNIGYAFAQVNPVPDINREDKTVGITLQVVPGPRVNVRRIVFQGNTRTADEVLRREMRQFEGAWYSQAAIDRSKIRLQGLGFFESVDVQTEPVPGSNDLVDVVINVKETPSGSFVFGLGYSQLSGVTTQVQLTQNNFLGTGNRISTSVQRSDFLQRYDFSFMNPYFTDSGVSLGYNLWYREFDFADYNTAQYSSTSGAAQMVSSIPITETDSISFLLGIDSNEIFTYPGRTPQEAVDYVTAVGQRTFHAWRGEIGWGRNTLNHALTPTRGSVQRVWLEATLPGSTAEYFKINYSYSKFWPLSRHFVLNTRAELGYGDSYGDAHVRNICFTAGTSVDHDNDPDTRPVFIPGPDPTEPCLPSSPDYVDTVTADGLPFFENFYAGGTRSVRGFADNTLGPQVEPFGQAIGGALKTVGSLEMFFPTLLDTGAARISAFVDFGNVYRDIDAFDAGEMRASTGVALMWRSPMGPISISYAMPLRDEEGDELERLQFTFGGQF